MKSKLDRQILYITEILGRYGNDFNDEEKSRRGKATSNQRTMYVKGFLSNKKNKNEPRVGTKVIKKSS